MVQEIPTTWLSMRTGLDWLSDKFPAINDLYYMHRRAENGDIFSSKEAWVMLILIMDKNIGLFDQK